MEAADEPLFQEVLNEVSCKSSNPLTLSLFADRVELASEEPKCCKGGKRSLDDGNRNIIRVPFDKIIGCHVLNSSMAICDEGESQQSSSHLGIYAFQEEFVHVKQKRVTKIKLDHHLFGTGDPHRATNWYNRIEHQLLQWGRPKSARRLLMLINPRSGPGKARSIFEKTVAPLLDQSSTRYDVVVTSNRNHARDLVCGEEELARKWTDIVIVSGDGLLFEMLQGIFRRDDWKDVISQVRFGIIAGGSGNGLARSLAHENGVKYSPGNGVIPSTLSLIKHRSKRMDLLMIHTASGKNMYSFLSVGWGLLSDIDIESERLRFLGESRFAAWTLVRTLNLRSYRGRLSFKLAQPMASTQAKVDDENIGAHIDELHGQEWVQQDTYASAEALPCHMPAPVHLKPLNEPVPDDWVVIEDEFLFMYAVNCAYIGTDVLFAPKLSTDDGRIALVFMRKGVSRVDMTRFFLGMENGAHLEIPGAEYHEVEAFRLEPAISSTNKVKGHITVDGEVINYEAIQGEVLPSFIKIIA